MKIRYEPEDDVMMIEFNKKPIDYAEQSGDLIMHFSPKGEAVLLEILNASDFLKETSRALPPKIRQAVFA
ncbi:hypothetical protein A2875_00920 [Candidatus Gottesmanbacteria bacterium RIFCSPHIGHO2_01_FULL_46_14]|uniref:DUF2283 domain-containing protein n=2 Tax=Candidatus Gottesmaniibacteriota TaxID=1752720 RepID=A0A1F5ZNZ5_9BACT|nr:MAG: hypothetical protein A2875_00920 [Candidatus Gottesmanbacteria bacterium RIFCSPHIGHO2_01_FULL_46_14]OGG29831.1 MAG: hypothetical protein A2971_03480 [Candidatus Gottesmanbacteria bacterium RIFCSPLOWO2_01_FULL_46_21]